MTKSYCKRLFGSPGFFAGWTEAEIFLAIQTTFLAYPEKMQLVLRPEFKKASTLATLRQHWRAGTWSFGYCFYIAEAAKLMLLSARPGVEFRLREVKSKKKLGVPLPSELKKHFALFYDGLSFDPEEGHAVGQIQYGKVKGSRFRLPPSVNSLLILAWIVEHCERAQMPKRIPLAQLQPALQAVIREWKPGGRKAELKAELSRLAGL